MIRRFALLFTVLAVFLGAGFFYFAGLEIPAIPANFSKAWDFLEAVRSVDGLPWWSPMFMQGTSLAHAWSFMATNAAIWVFSIPLGFLMGTKMAVLAAMLLGSAGCYCFLSRFTSDEVIAWLGAAFFLLCPSLLTRAAGYEHFVVVCAMALLPWTFYSLLIFFRRPSLPTALFAAMSFSAVTLADGKTGVMALPVILLYSVTEYFAQPYDSRPRLKLMSYAVLAFVLLAVIPNLPALRETKFVAMFEFGPFAGWQRVFSTKSALGLIDRAGLLTKGIDGNYAPSTGNGGTYLGLAVFVIFTIALFLRTFHDSSAGRKARLFLALALFAFWLSFGPKGLLGGQLFFLALSGNAPDFCAALGWFFFFVPVWIIFRLVPPEWPGRWIPATIFSAIYLLVPGFRILEWLPFYKNIRAPFDFFQVTGAVCVVISAAIVSRLLFSGLRPGVPRTAIITAVCALVVLDVSPYAKPFFQDKLEAGVFKDFLAAEDQINSSPTPGRVYAFSGRYFYLLTPYLTGRPLVAEAFNGYLQQRGAAILQGMAFANDEWLASYLNISGVSHVLIDKNDPDTPRDLQLRLRSFLPVSFENDNFAVLENKKSLGPGFLAQDFIQTPDSQIRASTAAFGGVIFNMAVIEMLGSAKGEPGLRGKVVDGKIEPIKSDVPMVEGHSFERVALAARGNFQSAPFAATGSAGWLVMTQAWHPDWKAFQDGKSLEIHRAFLAFPSVKTDGKQGVEFRFQQPWWYNLCAGIGIFSWVSGAFYLLVSRWLPLPFRLTSAND